LSLTFLIFLSLFSISLNCTAYFAYRFGVVGEYEAGKPDIAFVATAN